MMCFLMATASALCAQEDDDQSEKTIREAATRSIRLIEQSSATYLKKRKCTSCHHQAMSLMVFRVAQRVGMRSTKRIRNDNSVGRWAFTNHCATDFSPVKTRRKPFPLLQLVGA